MARAKASNGESLEIVAPTGGGDCKSPCGWWGGSGK